MPRRAIDRAVQLQEEKLLAIAHTAILRVLEAAKLHEQPAVRERCVSLLADLETLQVVVLRGGKERRRSPRYRT